MTNHYRKEETIVHIKGNLLFSYEDRLLIFSGKKIPLTYGENELLHWLANKQGGILSSKEYALLRGEYPLPSDLKNDSRMKNYVLRLRRKCHVLQDSIETVHNGYKLLTEMPIFSNRGGVKSYSDIDSLAFLGDDLIKKQDHLRDDLLAPFYIEEKEYSNIVEYVEKQILDFENVPHVPGFIIEATGGSGKTCGLLKIVEKLENRTDVQPIYIPVKRFFLPLHHVVEKISVNKKKRILLMLDGFDEVDIEKQQNICDEINEIKNIFPSIYFITSTRYAGAIKVWLNFPVGKLKGLSILSFKDEIEKVYGSYPGDFSSAFFSPMILNMLMHIKKIPSKFDIQISEKKRWLSKTDLFKIYCSSLNKTKRNQWIYDFLLPLLAIEIKHGKKIDSLYLRALCHKVMFESVEKPKCSIDYFLVLYDKNVDVLPTLTIKSLRTALDYCGLLVWNEAGQYHFIHEDYLDFFAVRWLYLFREYSVLNQGVASLIEEIRFYRVYDGKNFSGIPDISQRVKWLSFSCFLFETLLDSKWVEKSKGNKLLLLKLGLSISNTLDDIRDSINLYNIQPYLSNLIKWYCDTFRKEGYDYTMLAGMNFFYYGLLHIPVEEVLKNHEEIITEKNRLLAIVKEGLEFCQKEFDKAKTPLRGEYWNTLNHIFHCNLGAYWLEKGNWNMQFGEIEKTPIYLSEAIRWHEKGGEIIAPHYRALGTDYFVLAEYYEKMGDIERAKKHYHLSIQNFQKAVEIVEKKFLPSTRLSFCYLALSRLDRLEKDYYIDLCMERLHFSWVEIKQFQYEDAELKEIIKGLELCYPMLKKDRQEFYFAFVNEIYKVYRDHFPFKNIFKK